MKTTLKPYKSTDCDSYASGAYAAMELMRRGRSSCGRY